MPRKKAGKSSPSEEKPPVDIQRKEDTPQVNELFVSGFDEVLSCSGSRVSSRSKATIASQKARSDLLVARLREKQLVEEIESENQQRLLKARNEIELAELKLRISENEERDTNSVIVVDKTAQLDRYMEDCRKNSEKEHRQIIAEPNNRDNSDLPKVELGYFDGNTSDYWKFVKQFEYYIENRVSDMGQRFLYLLYYCKGRAKLAIEECIMLPPEAAYVTGREILSKLFGQNHEVARALIDKLTLGLKTPVTEPESLSLLAIRLQNCVIALSQMKYEAKLEALPSIEKIVRMLPRHIRQGWVRVADSLEQRGREPSFDDLGRFIETEARLARSRFGQLVSVDELGPDRVNRLREPYKQETRRANFHSIQQEPVRMRYCSQCKGDHYLKDCDRWIGMTVSQRWDFVRQNDICFSCLVPGHRIINCRRKQRCDVDACAANHHSMLHRKEGIEAVPSVLGRSNATNTSQPGTFLGVVPVSVSGPNGVVLTYAFLDNGSDTTLISKGLVRRLGLNGTGTSLTLTTVNGTRIIESELNELEIRSLDGLEMVRIERAFTVPKLPVCPQVSSPNEEACHWPHLKGIQFDDILEREVTLLIGCDVPEAHWVLDQRRGDRKQPYAVKTLLGWMLLGPGSNSSPVEVTSNFIHRSEDGIRQQLENLYHAEFGDTENFECALSIDDLKAVEIVKSSTWLDDDHYVVPLPWRTKGKVQGNNYEQAIQRLYSLKSRLVRDPDLHSRYVAAMDLTIAKGYAIRVPEDQLKAEYKPRWYLPHHPVINPKKPNKIRVVLDCAAKHRGLSLNDHLYQGPDTVSELVGILLRFRSETVAVTADVEEMFMQVKVPLGDRGALRFLWWPAGRLEGKPLEYQMTAHPFGATSSPFCANFALRKTVEEFGDCYPKTVTKTVKSSFYVDDCLACFPDVETAAKFVHQVRELLACGGFRLRKWSSNSAEVLDKIPVSERAQPSIVIETDQGRVERTLGLEWKASTDTFHFRFRLPKGPFSRRSILSAVSSIFDPLGILSPLLLPAKLILQRLCRATIGWDDPLNKGDLEMWLEWVNTMENIDQLQIPRCYKKGEFSLATKTQLHIFCDASESGYGAVAYVRYQPVTEEPYCALVLSKARVTPIKATSIPRLELAAALLATKVFAIINRNIDFFEETFFWTDSMTVLYYINNTSTRFSTFVANRLAIIHQLTEPNRWNYVPSTDNVADLASRGTMDPIKVRLWLEGPEFLRRNETLWPAQMCIINTPSEVELKKPSAMVNMTVKADPLDRLFSKYSDWMRLLKAVAWLRRFCAFMKDRTLGTQRLIPSGVCLSVSEIVHAKWVIIQYVQKGAYPAEERQIRRLSRLRKLCPTIIDGLICVGGRLEYTSYSSNRKHPAILPSRHVVTELIIRYYHALEGHCGVSQVLAAIRREFWIVQGAAAVKRTIGLCMVCRRQSAHLCRQLMAPLPVVRAEIGWHPFHSIGVDYFGPFLVKRGRGTAKRYGCIFTCLQTRAVHLEVAHSLSTDTFIMALMRFIARRGNPSNIYSDNGTNFVGAARELKGFLEEWDQHKINNSLLHHGIQWHFQPPSSSHRGGVWERMIRSVRRILVVLSNEQPMCEEVLLTLMTEAERILNDRPLIPLTADSQDNIALTPNHLLLLRGNPGIEALDNMSARCSKYWRQAQYLAGVFWRRWSREYVTLLQTRQKWITKVRNLKNGDVVLVASDGLHRCRWPLGVVVECHQSTDQLVRTVSIRTKDGVIKRDIRRVCLLEGSE